MDFYLPERKIALFVDGGVWHADPRLFVAIDILFFRFKTSRKEPITAEEVWKKDRIHTNYLKSKGYTVVRFWKKEIMCDINRCIEIVKKRIQAFKKNGQIRS